MKRLLIPTIFILLLAFYVLAQMPAGATAAYPPYPAPPTATATATATLPPPTRTPIPTRTPDPAATPVVIHILNFSAERRP